MPIKHKRDRHFFSLHADVFITQCSTVRYPFRHARHQTLPRSPRNICTYRFQPLCQLLDAGARPTFQSSCWIIFHRFSSWFRSGEFSSVVPPRRRFALCQSRTNHPHGLGMKKFVRLARFSDIHVTKRPEVGAGPATWPHVASEALGNNNLVWHRPELNDVKSALQNSQLLRKYWKKKYWKYVNACQRTFGTPCRYLHSDTRTALPAGSAVSTLDSATLQGGGGVLLGGACRWNVKSLCLACPDSSGHSYVLSQWEPASERLISAWPIVPSGPDHGRQMAPPSAGTDWTPTRTGTVKGTSDGGGGDGDGDDVCCWFWHFG